MGSNIFDCHALKSELKAGLKSTRACDRPRRSSEEEEAGQFEVVRTLPLLRSPVCTTDPMEQKLRRANLNSAPRARRTVPGSRPIPKRHARKRGTGRNSSLATASPVLGRRRSETALCATQGLRNIQYNLFYISILGRIVSFYEYKEKWPFL